MSRLLTEDRKHVEMLSFIRIDRTLPKYRLMPKTETTDSTIQLTNESESVTPFYVHGTTSTKNSTLSYENLKKLLSEKNDNIMDFNISVTKRVNEILDKTTMNNVFFNDVGPIMSKTNGNGKENLWKVIKAYLTRKKKIKDEENKIKSFDIVKFFSDVHDLVSDEEANKYINRIAEYVECIGYTEITGQTALKEKLIKQLVINKLESVLYAKGLYKAINEDVIVRLAHNAPKPLSLDYIENYVRNIPVNVLVKKMDADKLMVFDNYCILYYDENGESFALTDKEREREIEKRKDPILFGLINGSHKLYYIADWVDEYCDLTFEKMTEIVGKEMVEKGFLSEKIA